MKSLAYSNKGQLGGVIYLLLVIVLAGIILVVFSPTIDEFRVERINDIDNYENQNNTFMKIFLYALKPLMWIFYLFLSVIVLFLGIRALQQ